jgi:hypothetical protein
MSKIAEDALVRLSIKNNKYIFKKTEGKKKT